MKIPQYTKHSGISITLSELKSFAQIRKKQFSEVLYDYCVAKLYISVIEYRKLTERKFSYEAFYC